MISFENMKKFLRYGLGLVFLATPLMMAAALPTPLDLLDQNILVDIQDQGDRAASAFGNRTDETTLTQYVANIIAVFLGLLGTIFIVLMIYSGYTWMTAAGNVEKVSKAQATIKVAIIGLIIITAAYAITYFIFSRLPD